MALVAPVIPRISVVDDDDELHLFLKDLGRLGHFELVGSDLPILILTGHPDARDFLRSLMGGAKGFLVKPVSAEEFLVAMHDVLRGDFAMAKAVIPFLVQIINQVGQVTRENALTTREGDILACLFEGMQDKEIASKLGIGTATVHTHMHRLFEKLGVHSRRDIVAKYLQCG